jgi:hypothetical protein
LEESTTAGIGGVAGYAGLVRHGQIPSRDRPGSMIDLLRLHECEARATTTLRVRYSCVAPARGNLQPRGWAVKPNPHEEMLKQRRMR